MAEISRPAASLVESLAAVRDASLKKPPSGHVAKVVRRVVDGEGQAPPLEVAAFNSAI